MNGKQFFGELRGAGLPVIGANDAGRVTLRDAGGERVVQADGTWAVEKGLVSGSDAELAQVAALKAAHIARPRVKQGGRQQRAMEALALKLAGVTMPAWADDEFNRLVADGGRRA